MTTEDLCHMTNHLRDVKLPNMTTSLRNYLHSIIKATHSLEQYGEVKLLYVVYNALVNNAFDELTYNAINSRPKQIPTTKNTTAVTKHRRMTKKQFICMKNKKLSKKDNVRKVILPMYARNMRKFTESKEYKSVKENYGNAKFFLWCCDEENTNFINSNQKKTSVKLYMKDERVSLFEAVRKELMQIAAKLQADLDREREKLKQVVGSGDLVLSTKLLLILSNYLNFTDKISSVLFFTMKISSWIRMIFKCTKRLARYHFYFSVAACLSFAEGRLLPWLRTSFWDLHRHR